MANRFAREMTWTIRAAVAVVLAMAAHAQQQPAARVEFEVVSVKPGDPANGGGGMTVGPGRLEMRNTTLKNLLRYAYHLNEFQLEGGPKWMDSAKFDIDARLPAGALAGQAPLMMRATLADRFSLVVHLATRTRSEYALVVARGGPKLQTARDNEFQGYSGGPRMIRGTSQPMSGLAQALVNAVGAPVIDQTGLKGQYDLKLDFAPFSVTPAAEDDNLPSIFTALQEQLGLKLDPIKGPVEVLVIDHAEMPSAN